MEIRINWKCIKAQNESISKQAQGDLRGESLSLLEKTQTHCKTHNAYKQVQYLLGV